MYEPCQTVRLLLHPIGKGGGYTYGRNFTGKFHVLGQGHLALLERALEISLANCLAAVCLLVDEGNQPVFDLEVHLEALANLLFEVTGRLDAKRLTTVEMTISLSFVHLRASSQSWRAHGGELNLKGRANIRLGWVGGQIDLLDLQDVVGWVAAEVEGVVSRHLVLLLDRNLVA